MFTWIVVIELVNTIWNMPTTPLVIVGNVKLRFKLLITETPPNLQPNFVAYPISTSFLTTSMLGATSVSTPMVVILALNDWITPTPTYYFWVSIIVASDTIGGAMLTRDRWCSILRLPIGIHCDAICGCECPFGSLLLVKIDEWIYWLCGPNWLPNSMPLNLFWTIGIPYSCSYGWSITAPATFYNSTCLTMLVLMWKGMKRQSMITCPSSSQNAQTLKVT